MPKNPVKPLVFKYHEAMSIFLGSKNVLNLVCFWVEHILGSKMFGLKKFSTFLGLSKISCV